MQLSIVTCNGRKHPYDLKMSAQYLALSCSRARVLHAERLTTYAPWLRWKKLWTAAAQTLAPACGLLVLQLGVTAGNTG